MAYKSMLRRKGTKIVSITEHAADFPTGKLLEAIIESVDEFYSENLNSQGHRRGRLQPPDCKQRPWELHLVEGGVQ